MTGVNAWHVLRKDLGVGPRSPIFLYAIVLPVILTLLIRVVFGSLFDPVPRLGIVDEGESQVVQNVRDVEGIQVTFPESAAALKTLVENNDLDGGLVLPAGFDGALQTGQMPNVQFFFGGQSLAVNRVVLGVTMVDLIREVAGSPAPIDVETITVGEGESGAHRLPPAAADRTHGGAHRGRADPGHEPGGGERRNGLSRRCW